MESAAVLRSFHYSVGTISNTKRPGTLASKLHTQGFTLGGKFVSPLIKRKETLVTCLKTSDTAVPTKSEDNSPQIPLEKSAPWRATFPTGFEALVMEVCDETEVAELKLKVGDFEMHLKRNIGGTSFPTPMLSTTSPPPIPTKPMIVSSPTAPPPSPPKAASEKASPFVNAASKKSPKLVALEASGATGYVLVSAPTVGSFRRGRTFKGKKQPPICKEGDVIKEGQVIGFLDQFGTELPVKSDVAGEVLKLLFNDGEPVGYGDPLLAVLPSFHGIK